MERRLEFGGLCDLSPTNYQVTLDWWFGLAVLGFEPLDFVQCK